MGLTDATHGETVPELCRPELLHELFEQQAARRPAAIALACGDERMTYGELDGKANQLARWLRSRGIGRGSLVGLLMPRSMDAYVGLLGILKSGAAYLPLDPDYPPERIQYVLSDAQVAGVVSTSAMMGKLGVHAARAVWLDREGADLAALAPGCIPAAETGTRPEDLCYLIYTSGSTGRPKGVMIEHRSTCHLVRAEGRLFQVAPEDRVFQGFSLAFDASVEEVWLAFYAGATLVAGTRDAVFSGPALSHFLAEAGITIFSTVPTQLAMMEADVPTMRLLILGGEACPPDLVRRWARAGRRLVNTYGPTEATVIATWAELELGQPVTIGRPIPNYSAWLLDEHQQPVPAGEAGELCLGGVGLARGYGNRPELTAEKFIQHIAPGSSHPVRLYRTGDRARWTAEGKLEFLGRLDAQVKLRGYRVELGEIESVLLGCPRVRAAAVAVREMVPGVPQLVGYLVLESGEGLAEDQIKQILRQRLPAFMVPALLETLPALPVLPSGKVDRQALPPPRPRAAAADPAYTAPRTPLERKLAAVWERMFTFQKVSIHADFFHDLGGHSLLAARLASELRQDAELRHVSILDLYRYSTIAALAQHLTQSSAGPAAPAGEPQSSRIPRGRHFACGLAQLLSLYGVLGIFSLQWAAPYLTYTWLYEDGYLRWQAILAAFGVLTVLYPALLLVAVAVKWVVIGRFRPGTYPLWGAYYFRFWLVNTIQSSVPVHYLSGTPWLNWYYRLLGARIGRDVHLATPCLACHDLVEVGEGASVGVDASLAGFHVENGQLILGRIRVGRDAWVGTRAVMRENTALQDHAALEDLSLLPAGASVPEGERWQGSPARPMAGAERGQEAAVPQPGGTWRYALLHLLGIILFPACVLAAVMPGVVALNALNYADDYYWYLTVAPLIALSFVVLLALEMVVIKWLLLGRVKPGRYPLRSGFYLRKWFVDQLLYLSLDLLGPLYASIYLAPWYRLMGARLGRNAEVSTAPFISPDLLELGDETFIADSVSLGAARIERGHFTIGINRVGQRGFVGNSAMLPPGAAVGDHALVGCLSRPPEKAEDAAQEGATWLGSPPFRLPQRQASTSFAAAYTFQPGARLRAMRAAIEFIRVIAPATGFVVLTSFLFSAMVQLGQDSEWWWGLCWLPFYYAAAGLMAAGGTVALKWMLVGRYRAGERPLWDTLVWRNELINALHDHLAGDFLVGLLAGTPFLCWFFRLLGARIGKRVYLDTTDLTEFDLVSIGDEAEINADATLQTHLFEDRVMKMARVEIGPQCTVGSLALVLYDTRMEAGARLNDLSLLMKGETLPGGTNWEGIPARPAGEEAQHT